MDPGELALEPTLVGVLTAGYSDLELFFRPPGEERRSIMARFDHPSAYRCGSCGTVLITGPHGTDTDCLSCGVPMALGVTTCSECGWTYQEAP